MQDSYIYDQENFLSPAECQWLIKFFKEYHPTHGKLDIDRRLTLSLLKMEEELTDDVAFSPADPIKLITSKITRHIADIAANTFIHYHQIVAWPETTFQKIHLDWSYHTHTSIIYLNDDFQGGQTEVAGQTITPKLGKIVTFQGNVIQHQVVPVVGNTRYTLAVWYKTLNLT
jgi:hypothetical protein